MVPGIAQIYFLTQTHFDRIISMQEYSSLPQRSMPAPLFPEAHDPLTSLSQSQLFFLFSRDTGPENYFSASALAVVQEKHSKPHSDSVLRCESARFI